MALSAALALRGRSAGEGADIPTARVARGTLLVTIHETGEVQAKEKKIVANNLPYTVVIAERVDEGAVVKRGDRIIRFECKELLDEIDRKKLDVSNAENDRQKATEDIDLTRKEWHNKVVKAEMDFAGAKSDLRKFTEHEREQLLKDAQSKLKLYEQDLSLAQGKLLFMQQVNTTAGLENTYSGSAVASQELAVDKLKLDVQSGQAMVAKLRDYELPRQEQKLQQLVKDAELEVERTGAQERAQNRLAEANLLAKTTALEMHQRRLEDTLAYQKELEVRAETAGIIVYDSGQNWRPPDLSVGALVPSRNRLMRIPDMATLRVFSRVFEGVSEKVAVGTPVVVRLDSRPGETFAAHVDIVASLASTENRWLNPNIKVFPVEIVLDESPSDLRPGSTAQVELMLAELHDVLIAPIAAVYTRQDETYCWKVVDGQPQHTPIKIGQMSDTQVEVLAGLSEGEEILLGPPPGSDMQPGKPQPTSPAAKPRPAADAANIPAATQPVVAPPVTAVPEHRLAS